MRVARKFMLFLVGLCAGFMFDITAMAEELEPTFIIKGTAENADTSKMQDGDHNTSIEYMQGDTITINAGEPQKIKGLYIIWDSPVQPWSLKADEKSISCGENAFLHEYIELDEEAASLEITIPADDICISDIRIFGDGELPDDVQVWNPPCERADIMIISSHADDELLFFGGVIPVYTYVYDADVQVVYMTEFWSTEKEREHEKLNGLWAAGLDIYPVCGDFMDKYSMELERARQQYDADELTGYITKVIREFKPQIVVTHDFNGEYGHGFHKLVTECTVNAIEGASNAEYYPESATEYGIWDTPKTYIHIYGENKLKLDLSVTIEEKQGKTALQLVKDGYAQHISQHKWSFYVSDSYKYSCADFGLYRTTVGYDTGNDMLENLKTYKIQQKEEQERIEQESREQASIEQASREQESIEQASREQESREQASIEEASRQAASESESLRIAEEEAKREEIGLIIGIAAVLVIAGALIMLVVKKLFRR